MPEHSKEEGNKKDIHFKILRLFLSNHKILHVYS